MSAFVRTTNDEELRLRLNAAFAVGQLFAGTAVNPCNFVLFNPASTGPVSCIVTQIRLSLSIANSFTLFFVAADPGLAAGNTPSNRNRNAVVGSTMKWEVAVGALAIANTISAGQLAPGIPNTLLYPDTILLPQATGLVVQFPALVDNLFVSMSWYELIA